jgi:hypothetical protein
MIADGHHRSASFLPHDDPAASRALDSDTLAFEVRDDVGYGGTRRITVVRPTSPARRSGHRPPPPGLADDGRRPIVEVIRGFPGFPFTVEPANPTGSM